MLVVGLGEEQALGLELALARAQALVEAQEVLAGAGVALLQL